MNPDEIEDMGQGWMKRLNLRSGFLALSRAPFSFGRWPTMRWGGLSWGPYQLRWYSIPGKASP